ncbi:MAG: TlpA disulfide reductase family protein [Pirellulales bacterium]
MIRRDFIIILLSCVLWSQVASADDNFLTIGMHAPRFSADEFVRGNSFPIFADGTAYVVEFSGTKCGPCLKQIPHFESLQSKYPHVVMVAVFSEPVDDVQQYLDGPGKGMTIRVVCDSDHTMSKSWSNAAAQMGIPHVFIVNAAGVIGWLGHPADMDQPLSLIAGGGSVDMVEAMKLQLRQCSVLQRRRNDDRRMAAHEYNNSQITKLIQNGQLADAIAALDAGMSTHRDLPETFGLYRQRKLFVLGCMADRRQEAFDLACDIALEVTSDNNARPDNAANTILNCYEAAPENQRDERLPPLALAVLAEAKVPGDKMDIARGCATSHFRALARSYELSGDRKNAAAALQDAIAAGEQQLKLLRDREFEEWVVEESDVEDIEESIAAMRQWLGKFNGE